MSWIVVCSRGKRTNCLGVQAFYEAELSQHRAAWLQTSAQKVNELYCVFACFKSLLFWIFYRALLNTTLCFMYNISFNTQNSYEVGTISILTLQLKRQKYRGSINFSNILHVVNWAARYLCPGSWIPETLFLTSIHDCLPDKTTHLSMP